jgi:hypothetical protein
MVLSVKDMAVLLGCSEQAVYRQVFRRALAYRKMGSYAILVRWSGVEECCVTMRDHEPDCAPGGVFYYETRGQSVRAAAPIGVRSCTSTNLHLAHGTGLRASL